MINRYIFRIESLERDKEYIEKDYKSLNNLLSKKDLQIEKLKNENSILQESQSKLEENNKNNMAEIETLKKGHELNQMEILLQETKRVKELQSTLNRKDTEIFLLSKERATIDDIYYQENNNLKEKIEVLNENIGNLTEFKQNYNKLKDSIRDYEIMKENLKDYENTQTELASLQLTYNNILTVNLEQEERIKLLQIQLKTLKNKSDDRIILIENEGQQDKVIINIKLEYSKRIRRKVKEFK